MIKNSFLVSFTLLLVSLFLLGCGISQEDYERVNTQFRASQARVAELEKEYAGLQEEYAEVNAEFVASETRVWQLQSEISELRERYEIAGKTPAETAENIVRRYHETHIYSKYDFFVCSDMALDVWNMLKAEGINALVQIGNIDKGAENISEVDHTWVLAEVSPGQYLALETTGGYVVKDNPLYYQGWAFDNPREFKRFVELMREYEIRVIIIGQLEEAFEASRSAGLEAKAQFTKMANEVGGMSVLDPLLGSKLVRLTEKAEECGEYIGRCDQLNELISQQGQELENIDLEMCGLTE